MKKAGALGLSCVLLAALGCHSPFVNAVVRNDTAQPISLLELDYPSASFGTQMLAPGADYRYKFKVLGSGETKLSWTNTAQKTLQATGPSLQEGDEGTLLVTVEPNDVRWSADFKDRKLAASTSTPHPLMMPK